MSEAEQEPPLPQSQISAEQLLTRLLELIKTSATITDFTLPATSRALAIPLHTYGPGTWGYRARLTADWSYALTGYERFALGPRMLFDFIEDQPGSSPPLTEICQLDVKRFTKALSASGFANIVRYGEHDRRLGNRLVRDGLTVDVSVVGEADHPDGRADHLCVKSIMVR